MGMRIIRANILPEKQLWRGTCTHCGSIAECLQSDLKKIGSHQIDGKWAWSDCPVCKKRNGMCFQPSKAQT